MPPHKRQRYQGSNCKKYIAPQRHLRRPYVGKGSRGDEDEAPKGSGCEAGENSIQHLSSLSLSPFVLICESLDRRQVEGLELRCMRFLAIDFETADYGADSACAVGMVLVDRGELVQEFVRLIRPPRSRVMFTSVHGLSWSDLEGASDFGALWPEMEPLFEQVDFIVAHNASFDKKVLASCCRAHNIAMPALPFRCSVQLSRNVLGIKPANLANVCKVLGIELNHHEALSDARACALITLKAEAHRLAGLTP
jgi:DNA polymerase-3 subunit epsilon